jgi:hypothetical protein
MAKKTRRKTYKEQWMDRREKNELISIEARQKQTIPFLNLKPAPTKKDEEK